MVNGIARIAPIAPNIQVQKISEIKIINNERLSSSPMNFGLIIFSTMALIKTNPIIIMIASVIPSSAKARKAGGITLKINPILGIKLNKNDKNAHKNAKSTPRMSISIRLPTAVNRPVEAEMETYFRISSANSGS